MSFIRVMAALDPVKIIIQNLTVVKVYIILCSLCCVTLCLMSVFYCMCRLWRLKYQTFLTFLTRELTWCTLTLQTYTLMPLISKRYSVFILYVHVHHVLYVIHMYWHMTNIINMIVYNNYSYWCIYFRWQRLGIDD